jgi:signal transduction histidine kinase
MEREEMARRLEPHWNHGMIAASIAISLLGAFTSTQLMCQARISVKLSSILVWTSLGSLTFGFCSIWSLHFVATLACELDLPIGINVPLTLLSALLAVLFTFAALASDLVWSAYNQRRRKRGQSSRRGRTPSGSGKGSSSTASDYLYKPLLSSHVVENGEHGDFAEDPEMSLHSGLIRDLSPGPDPDGVPDSERQPQPPASDQHAMNGAASQRSLTSTIKGAFGVPSTKNLPHRSHSPTERISEDHGYWTESSDSMNRRSSERSMSRRSSLVGSSSGSLGLSNIINLAVHSVYPAKNPFIATAEALYAGCTFKHIIKGFFWSLAITSMHYVGIIALEIPDGHFTLDPLFFVFSGIISWVVCLVGCILMSQMETHLARQFLFSIVATTGVAAMHFTGMQATTFWSYSGPSNDRGYPPALAIANAIIAITTCIAANGLLAHAATVSRNKLAEVMLTRKKLWRTIAQKENAEAAARARSEFIASASHEIRTPLHHLQGYSDLMARTELTEEGRVLLRAIQRATKTLSLITNNVLDWSKLERETEAACCPVALDIRTVCEAILVLLPNKDDEVDVDVLVVVSPSVPKTLFLDETYIHRILMNLLSNALKFTSSGYILLLVKINDGNIVATVKDTGCGIPPSFRPELFEPFKQAHTRGSQRGTGLGLSIIKQLLSKMNGSIDVQSEYAESSEAEQKKTGSTFTITIPVQLPTPTLEDLVPANESSSIAIFSNAKDRYLEGLRTAWEVFGFNVVFVKEYSDLSGSDWKYIWADALYLKENPELLNRLIAEDQWLVLVPFDNQATLQQNPRLLSAPNIIPLQKPLMWHSFQQRINAASQSSHRVSQARTVRFAPKVDIFQEDVKDKTQEMTTAKNFMVLLVEDNPV